MAGIFDTLDEEKQKKELGSIMPPSEDELLRERIARRMSAEAVPADVGESQLLRRVSDYQIPQLNEFEDTVQGKVAPVLTPAQVTDKAKKQKKAAEIMKTVETTEKGISEAVKADPEGVLTQLKDDAKSDPKDPMLQWLDEKVKVFEDKAAAKRDSIEWRQAIETMAQAATRIFAARAGLKAGVDLSNLQMSTTDYDKQLQALDDRLEKNKEQATAAFSAAKKAQEDQRKTEADAAAKAAELSQRAKESALSNTLEGARLAETTRHNKATEGLASAERAQQIQIMQAKQQADLAAKENVDPKLVIPGFGVGRDPQEAEKFRTEVADAQAAVADLKDIIRLGQDIGPLDFERRKLIQANLNSAVGKLRLSLTGPGAMTESEREIVKESLGDPSKFFSTEQIETSKLNNMIDKINASVSRKAELVIDKPVASAPASSVEGPIDYKPGLIRRGYEFQGGDAKDPKNWKKVQ
jgi:hypothetical protein